MPRTCALVVAVAALLVVVPGAKAAGSWSIGATGGVTIPVGDFGKSDSTGLDAGTGPQAGIDICYHLNERVAIGVDAAWVQNKHGAEGSVEDFGGGQTLTANKDKFKILRVGAHAKFMVPMEGSRLGPYGVVGLGLYNFKEDYEYTLAGGGAPTVVFTDESDNVEQPGSRFGGKVGIGTTIQANEKFGFHVQGDYNYIRLDKDKFGLSSVQYIGIQAGVHYNIMPQ